MPSAASEVPRLVEHLFRHRAGRMLATLTRIFGAEHVELAEDVVQDALIEALRRWPVSGVPDNPDAWLIQVAKRRALDIVRRERAFASREQDVRASLEREPALAAAGDALEDDQLRMIFLCCHPDVPLEGRVALTLKLVGGFSVAEIARAFLAEESATFQRLVRAKRRIRESRSPFVVPSPDDLRQRLDAVLEVLYLLFNEGHTASSGDELLRADLCAEAIRLASLLLSHSATHEPRVHALLALFLFHASRFATRVDGAGDLVLLPDQDRSRWDRALIERAFGHLARAASGDVVTHYHLEAEIASCHALAARYEDTDWRRIASVYDALYAMHPSPLVALNRAIAVSELDGAAAGLRALDTIAGDPSLGRYYLLPAARAELLRRLGDVPAARRELAAARVLAPTDPVRRFLDRRSAALEGWTDTVESRGPHPSSG